MDPAAMPDKPTLGVLGGMGPAATADFLMRLARLTPADRDQDHVPTIVYSDPQTPDRSDAILGMGPSPLPAMIQGIDFLNRAGCALISIPCNTAHYWYDELASASEVPIMHIVDAAAKELRALAGGHSAGIMATDGTVRSGIYQDRLTSAGISTLDLLDMGNHDPVMRGIREMKAGKRTVARDTLTAGGRELISRGAQVLVVACTDVSTAMAGITSVDGIPLVDASACLASASLAKLGGAG